MPVTDPLVLTVTAKGRQGTTEVWANVFHVRNDTGNAFDQTMAQGIAGHFETFWLAIDTFLHDQWFLDTIQVESEVTGIMFEESYTITGPNTNPLPFDTAVVVSWGGNPNNRRTRGRNYIAGWDEDHNDDGILSSAAQTALLAAADALGGGLLGNDTPLVVWSDVLDDSTLVERVRVGRRYDSQRRRVNKIAESYATLTIS